MKRSAPVFSDGEMAPEVAGLVSALEELSESVDQDMQTTVEELEKLVRRQLEFRRLQNRLGLSLKLD